MTKTLPTRVGHINFTYSAAGHYLYSQEPCAPLEEDAYIAQDVYFPDAEKRQLFICRPGAYHEVTIDVAFLTGRAGLPVVVEFLKPVISVTLSVIPTTPYLLQVFREDEENVLTYRHMRLPVTFRSDRADIQRIAFGHALSLIAIEAIDFER
ncbi:MAG: hypothetical protein JXB35_01255 [Anaerolineae bacterium]|nr:hypothetical protein [Anaerolineae bacterium]